MQWVFVRYVGDNLWHLRWVAGCVGRSGTEHVIVTPDGEIMTNMHRGSAMIHEGNQAIAHRADEQILLAVYAMFQVLLTCCAQRTFNEACSKPLQM